MNDKIRTGWTPSRDIAELVKEKHALMDEVAALKRENEKLRDQVVKWRRGADTDWLEGE